MDESNAKIVDSTLKVEQKVENESKDATKSTSTTFVVVEEPKSKERITVTELVMAEAVESQEAVKTKIDDSSITPVVEEAAKTEETKDSPAIPVVEASEFVVEEAAETAETKDSPATPLVEASGFFANEIKVESTEAVVETKEETPQAMVAGTWFQKVKKAFEIPKRSKKQELSVKKVPAKRAKASVEPTATTVGTELEEVASETVRETVPEIVVEKEDKPKNKFFHNACVLFKTSNK